MPFYFPWEELLDLLSTHCTHHEGSTIFLGVWKAELMLGTHTLPRLPVTTPTSYANNCKSFLSIPFYAVRNYNGWWSLIYSQTYLSLPSCLNKALQVSSPCIWTSAQVSSSCFLSVIRHVIHCTPDPLILCKFTKNLSHIVSKSFSKDGLNQTLSPRGHLIQIPIFTHFLNTLPPLPSLLDIARMLKADMKISSQMKP